MYIPTGNDDIFALDGKTGRKIWALSYDEMKAVVDSFAKAATTPAGTAPAAKKKK